MYSDREDVSPPRMMLHAVTLTIPMKHEHISVTTRDPFTTDRDSNWQPSHVFAGYDDFFSSQIMGFPRP